MLRFLPRGPAHGIKNGDSPSKLVPGGIEPGKHRLKFRDTFVRKANETHSGNLDFSQANYVDTATALTVRCKLHDVVFQLTPRWLMTGGTRCEECKKTIPGRNIKTVPQLVEEATKIHGDKYDYTRIQSFGTLKAYVPIVCPDHGLFKQQVFLHLHGRGCKHCALSLGNRRYTLETFIEAAQAIFGNTYDYSKVVYTGGHDHVTIICAEHGDSSRRRRCI